MMDIKEELPKLQSTLSLAISKIDKWMGDAQKTVRDYQLQGQELDNFYQELGEKAGNLQAIVRELTALTSNMDAQLQDKEHLSVELDHLKLSINKQQELLGTQEKTVDEKLKELNKGAEMFQDRLGLSFKKTSGNRLQIIFTNIDYKDPESPFYFFLKIDNGKYIISDCEPAVDDLDMLVDELNKTNNLHSFMVGIRKRFKKHVEK